MTAVTAPAAENPSTNALAANATSDTPSAPSRAATCLAAASEAETFRPRPPARSWPLPRLPLDSSAAKTSAYVSRSVLLGRVRAATEEPEAARLIRELVARDLHTIARALNDDRPELRTALVGTQVVGLALAREIVSVEPLPKLSGPELVELLAPTFQRYFTGPLD
jgi:hypothetical protein